MDEEPDVASGSWLSQFEDLGRVIGGGGEVALELEASGGCAGSERVIEEFDLDILEGDIPDGDPVDGEAFSQVEIQVTGERQAQDGEALPIIAGGRVGGGIGVGGEVVVEVGGSAGEMGGEAGLVDEVDDLGVFVVGAERIIGDGDWADDMTWRGWRRRERPRGTGWRCFRGVCDGLCSIASLWTAWCWESRAGA
ncbi:MAG: hypothetical protein ACO34E_16315 [Limisphaerales bacterium]